VQISSPQNGLSRLSGMTYPVRLPVFEGPLHLLLHLIRTQKLDICDIPIASVTEQYLEYLALMELLDLNVAGEFLLMAATLMEIKSRILLPRPEPLTAEDEGVDPRAELVARLLEYERFQQVAEQLRDLATETQKCFPRSAVEEWEGAVPLVELRPVDLIEALRRMLKEDGEESGPERGPSLRVRRHAVNLKQRIAEVLRRVQGYGSPLPFSLLIPAGHGKQARLEILVTFLAILELIRQEQISAWQQGPLGEILLVAGQSAPDPALVH
jgi:segregation and condensation protein A